MEGSSQQYLVYVADHIDYVISIFDYGTSTGEVMRGGVVVFQKWYYDAVTVEFVFDDGRKKFSVTVDFCFL